ncbi:hypothetical protein JAAARDRAFT_63399 [Jaapia argillacea MUCL 33604]|uniref:G-alpha-domain-containing protein n=1 Tax=Jaapia argillacea MUCL 33604 TaxID=933084 RepID=A0A067P521_9AGAM|nr:hypothetical protein JAAARDRAFT_63399 [Jaapia argillacea MUCL 33604]
MGRTSPDANDPFHHFTAPPPDETPEERSTREKREAEAKRISDEIDEILKGERLALKKGKKPIKVLLLGQSESGKSTTLKNFQIAYAREGWKAERASWRAVVQLNLVKSVIVILNALEEEMAGHHETQSSDPEDEDRESPQPTLAPVQFTEKHQLLKLRLRPLRRIEADLRRALGAASDDIESPSAPLTASPFDSPRRPEFCVRSWKGALERNDHVKSATSSRGSNLGHGNSLDSDEATDVIAECREDMKALWQDEIVRHLLGSRKMRMENSAGFFLNDIDRIATRSYSPNDDDVVRARLRTLGVQEHRLTFEEGPETGREWVIYDVGGSRTMRAAWVPFFDDVNAIIFLAPVSCFDERLVEDPRVNRLEDTFLLWKSIVSSPLLAKATIVLFMNKCDILHSKLKSGIMVKKYMPSYGDRDNSTNTVIKYLRTKFKDMQKQYSPQPRAFYGYATTCTDTKATTATLESVRDGILRDHLKQADLV